METCSEQPLSVGAAALAEVHLQEKSRSLPLNVRFILEQKTMMIQSGEQSVTIFVITLKSERKRRAPVLREQCSLVRDGEI